MANNDQTDAIEQQLSDYVTAMEALNIVLTPEEINTKRIQIKAQMSGELVPVGAEVESWNDVQALLETPTPDVLVVDDFQKLDDKSQLVNVPFFIKQWWFADSELIDPETGEPRQFAVLRCLVSRPILTPAGATQKIVLSDGSTGIYRQLRETTQRTGQTSKMMVRNGLRVSQYTIELEGGSQQAETFYLT